MLKFYIIVFKFLYFLYPLIDFNYIWYDERYWPESLFCTVPTPVDLQVKVTALEKFYIESWDVLGLSF